MSLKAFHGKRTALALIVGVVMGGATASAIAAVRMTRVTAVPSTTVITQPDIRWTASDADVIGAVYRRILLSSVSAKATGYPVARLGALSASLALPSGSALGLTEVGDDDSVPYCYALLAMDENPDGEGWSVESPSAYFMIHGDSPARSEDVNIRGLAESLSASQAVRIRMQVSCLAPGGDFLPDPATFSLSNIRLTLTAFGA